MSIETNRLTAWLTINRSCDLRCRWCYAKMTGFASQDMSMQKFSESLDLLQNMGIDRVILIGGEPTIHPLFLDFLSIIQERDMYAYLVTNAVSLADESLTKEIASIGIEAITVSLKAFNREDYHLLTGADVFEKVKQAVINIQEVSIPNVVNVTLSEETMQKSDELIRFMQVTGANSFSLDTGKPIILPDGSTNVDGMGTPQDLAKYFASAYRRFKTLPDIEFTFKIAIPFCLFSDDFLKEIIRDRNVLTGCQMATGSGIIIDPDGNIIPCNHLCHLALSNISEVKGVADYQAFRNKPDVVSFYTKASYCASPRCRGCKYWRICGSGCRLYWLHYEESAMLGATSISHERR